VNRRHIKITYLLTARNPHGATKSRFSDHPWHPAWKQRGPILASALHKFVIYLRRHFYPLTYSPGPTRGYSISNTIQRTYNKNSNYRLPGNINDIGNRFITKYYHRNSFYTNDRKYWAINKQRHRMFHIHNCVKKTIYKQRWLATQTSHYHSLIVWVPSFTVKISIWNLWSKKMNEESAFFSLMSLDFTHFT